MSTDSQHSRTFALIDVQVKATVVALRDRLFETELYISGAGYSPCHPTCEHCAPKVAYFAEIQAGLIERKKTIQSVLAVLDQPSENDPDES